MDEKFYENVKNARIKLSKICGQVSDEVCYEGKCPIMNKDGCCLVRDAIRVLTYVLKENR